MLARKLDNRMTEAAYLELERTAEVRHQWIDGEVFAMAGASEEHSLIGSNLITTLSLQTRSRRCRVHGSDRLIKTGNDNYTYADVAALCGQPEITTPHPSALLNPSLIIEILSPSTQTYDRGDKFEHYRTIPSLIDYVLVAQSKIHIETRVRQIDGSWLIRHYITMDSTIHLESIDASLLVSEVYRNIFDNDPE
ncbi:MAG TPA: Uma2 family endonuclease [Aggregatilineales bacterium]|nr:Uma2 family endonuclease [Aggregatilineales bacterium]